MVMVGKLMSLVRIDVCLEVFVEMSVLLTVVCLMFVMQNSEAALIYMYSILRR